jgi:hypothetical protein
MSLVTQFSVLSKLHSSAGEGKGMWNVTVLLRPKFIIFFIAEMAEFSFLRFIYINKMNKKGLSSFYLF